MKKLGPLNLSEKREAALKCLLDFVVESGVFPPSTSYEENREIAAVRGLLQYRVTRRKKANDDKRHEIYREERAALEPLAEKIAQKKLKQHRKQRGANGIHTASVLTRFKCEAMDVLAYMHLGSRHTWLERELKADPDYVKNYLTEAELDRLVEA